MALVTWKSSLSVKIEQFDLQHITLVEMINELHNGMKSGKGKEVLGEVISGLVCYTESHFADEEQLMAEHDYPDRDAHKAQHDSFVKQVHELRQQFLSGQVVLTPSVMLFLMDWLIKHIKGVDLKYGAYLNAKGVS